jgi:hypothetical protein
VCQDTPLRWDYLVYVVELRPRTEYGVLGFVSRADFASLADLSQYEVAPGLFWPLYTAALDILSNFEDLIALHDKLRAQPH